MKMFLMFFVLFQICLLGHVYFAMPHGPPHGGAKVPTIACDDCDHSADVWEKFQPDDGDPVFVGANALLALLGEGEETTSASNATGFCNAPDPDSNLDSSSGSEVVGASSDSSDSSESNASMQSFLDEIDSLNEAILSIKQKLRDECPESKVS